LAAQIRDEVQSVALDRLAQHFQLRRPTLKEKGDEGELALSELVRIGHVHQHRACVGDARRSLVHVAVEEILDRLFRHFHLLGFGVRLVDRKSTRLNSSHVKISYAVFCLKKKKKK